MLQFAGLSLLRRKRFVYRIVSLTCPTPFLHIMFFVNRFSERDFPLIFVLVAVFFDLHNFYGSSDCETCATFVAEQLTCCFATKRMNCATKNYRCIPSRSIGFHACDMNITKSRDTQPSSCPLFSAALPASSEPSSARCHQ
jgi:hypothetical protein